MYRLLVVTKDPRTEAMFTAMEGWEAIGYKPPRLRKTVDEAKECIGKHPIDAIAIEDDKDFSPLLAFLDQEYPQMPIFPLMDSPQAQWAVMKEVSQLLSQLYADFSNDQQDSAHRLQQAQERWIKKLVSGMAPSREYILAHHRMLRCPEIIERPCLFARLSLPTGDGFLSERWHYGSDRLEVALRNFFGGEHGRMRLHVAVVSPQEVRMLVSPKPELPDAELTPAGALGYIEETIEQIEHYLGLSMSLIDIRALQSLVAFAAEEHQI